MNSNIPIIENRIHERASDFHVVSIYKDNEYARAIHDTPTHADTVYCNINVYIGSNMLS